MSQQGHIVVSDALLEKFVSSTSYLNGTSYLSSVEIVTQIGDDGESRCQWQLYGWIKKHLGTMIQWGFLAILCRRQDECLSSLCGWGNRLTLKTGWVSIIIVWLRKETLIEGDATERWWNCEGLRPKETPSGHWKSTLERHCGDLASFTLSFWLPPIDEMNDFISCALLP